MRDHIFLLPFSSRIEQRVEDDAQPSSPPRHIILGVSQKFNLVEFCGEKVERGDDAAVGAEAVLLHDLLVVDRVPDVDVGRIRNLVTGRVQINHVRRPVLGSDLKKKEWCLQFKALRNLTMAP